MTVFESLNNTTEDVSDKAEKLLNTSKEYVKLKAFQQVSLSMSLLIKMIVIGGLAALSVIFLAVSGAIAIGQSLGNPALGYLIVCGLFFVLALIAYFLRKHIETKIISTFSETFFD